jgi:hypothetical protein
MADGFVFFAMLPFINSSLDALILSNVDNRYRRGAESTCNSGERTSIRTG